MSWMVTEVSSLSPSTMLFLASGFSVVSVSPLWLFSHISPQPSTQCQCFSNYITTRLFTNTSGWVSFFPQFRLHSIPPISQYLFFCQPLFNTLSLAFWITIWTISHTLLSMLINVDFTCIFRSSTIAPSRVSYYHTHITPIRGNGIQIHHYYNTWKKQGITTSLYSPLITPLIRSATSKEGTKHHCRLRRAVLLGTFLFIELLEV